MRDWEAHFIQRAWLNAEMSTCVRRHVGAVAVRDKRSFADGFNGNLPGAVHCDEGGCPRCSDDGVVSGEGLDLCVCVHAEANVIAYCARTGTPLEGATIYCTTRPCNDCTKMLISAGVIEIVYDENYPAADMPVGDVIVRRHHE